MPFVALVMVAALGVPSPGYAANLPSFVQQVPAPQVVGTISGTLTVSVMTPGFSLGRTPNCVDDECHIVFPGEPDKRHFDNVEEFYAKYLLYEDLGHGEIMVVGSLELWIDPPLTPGARPAHRFVTRDGSGHSIPKEYIGASELVTWSLADPDMAYATITVDL